MGIVRDILINQTRAIRKWWLIDEFLAGRRFGAYWGLDTQIDDSADPLSAATDNGITVGLAKIPTRMAVFDELTEGLLINWGYVLAGAALRRRARLPIEKSIGLLVREAHLN